MIKKDRTLNPVYLMSLFPFFKEFMSLPELYPHADILIFLFFYGSLYIKRLQMSNSIIKICCKWNFFLRGEMRICRPSPAQRKGALCTAP